jgi:hypothetical protein
MLGAGFGTWVEFAAARKVVRTPHLFASAFFVHISRFFALRFDCKNEVNHSSMLAAECGAGAGPVKSGYRPRLWRLSTLKGPVRPTFGPANSSTAR